jgi:hypothetical protein
MSIPTCSNERANGEEKVGHWCAALANPAQLFPRHQVSIYGLRDREYAQRPPKVRARDCILMDRVESLTASKRRWAMLCILLGLGLSSLGGEIPNIALPSISRSFASSDAATVWVVNAYQLSATVFLLPVASLAESLGLKRVYTAGLAIFVIASLGCAFAPTLPVLVIARLIQGAGAAGVAVAGVAFVRVIYPHRMVSKGLALVALAVAIPGALGPGNSGEVGCCMAVGPLRYWLRPFPDPGQHCDDDGWIRRT